MFQLNYVKAKSLADAQSLLKAHPDAKPKEVAQALGARPQYVHVLRSVDKKRTAEGKPIPRMKRHYTKRRKNIKFMELFSVPKNIDEMIEKAEEARKDLAITMIEPKADPVNHPPHYKVGGVETIDFIEAKQLNYNLGNVVKYITRADHKGNRKQDLEKALWYLKREVEAQNA